MGRLEASGHGNRRDPVGDRGRMELDRVWGETTGIGGHLGNNVETHVVGTPWNL